MIKLSEICCLGTRSKDSCDPIEGYRAISLLDRGDQQEVCTRVAKTLGSLSAVVALDVARAKL